MEDYFKNNPAFDLVEHLDSTLHTEVWKAIQTNLKRTVVLHILKPDSARDPREREHFLSIARSFAKIKSEGVASVFDIISDDDYHYVVMEYVEGPTLDDLARHAKKLTLEQILKIALSVASSFEQLWQGPHIIHRNLKSSVIRLDSRGIAKLVDFSLAIMQTTSTLDDGNIVGTPGFISPEQVQGVDHLTTQSDMYALGAVLYHLSTGAQPFYNADPLVTLNAQLREQLVPPHVLNPTLPVVFSWFIHRLMMKNPANRYAQWSVVIQDLHLMLTNQQPSCVAPAESFISTIDIAPLIKPATTKKPATKLKKTTQHVSLAEKEHQAEIRKENAIKSVVAWLILVAWLGAIFWFRAIVQKDPQPAPPAETTAPSELAVVETPMTLEKESAPDRPTPPLASEPPAVNAESPVADVQTAPVHHAAMPAPKPTPNPMPVAAPAPATEEPPQTEPKVMASTAAKAPPPQPVLAEEPSETLEIQLVEAISKGDAETCIKLLSENPEQFRTKANMLALLQKAPSVVALVEASARTLVGRPVPLLRNGRERIVTPRQVGNGMIQVEANGRTIDLPIAILTADEKLNWIDPPSTPAESLTYCLLLMHTTKRAEVEKQAENCPLFKRYLQKAAALTTTL